jgi:hypothetical protein
MAVAAQIETKHLGKLDIGKQKVRALMLPSDAKTIIVRYDDYHLRVTCSFPAMDRKVAIRSWRSHRISKRKTKIHTPDLLMSAIYGDVPTERQLARPSFYIYGFDKRQKDSVWAAIYALSNVYGSGKICFGSHRPKDLRAAYNLFWTAPFNPELDGTSHQLEAYDLDDASIHQFIKRYEEEIFGAQDWINYTNEICGKKYWASSSTPDAVLITANKELLKQIPKKYWRKRNKIPIFIGKAKKLKSVWSFDSGSVKFSLPHSAVVTK